MEEIETAVPSTKRARFGNPLTCDKDGHQIAGFYPDAALPDVFIKLGNHALSLLEWVTDRLIIAVAEGLKPRRLPEFPKQQACDKERA